MPRCRRDQTKFATFLAIMVTVEVITIVSIMHLEHQTVMQRSNTFAQEVQAMPVGRLKNSAIEKLSQSVNHAPRKYSETVIGNKILHSLLKRGL